MRSLKIPLADPQTELPEQVAREVASPLLSNLLISLLGATDDATYREIATRIQRESSPKTNHNKTYSCLHPNWFDEPQIELKIDSVTCSLCPYGHACSLGKDDRPSVRLVPLLNTKLPSKKLFADLFVGISNSSELPYDPFIGFSHQAGKPRDLYVIRYSSFLERFPDGGSTSYGQQYAVGYDRSTCSSLWPQDHAFLETYERLNKQNLEKFEDISPGLIQNLSILEKELILDVCYENEWLMDSDSEEIETMFLTFFAGIKHFLSSSSTFSELRGLMNSISMPGIDHPHRRSASRVMHMGLRWMEIKSQFFQNKFRESFANDEVCERLKSPVKVPKLERNQTTYIPRFPAIALLPRNQQHNIRLEHGACKILDVHEYHGNEVLLLFDGLGISMEEEI